MGKEDMKNSIVRRLKVGPKVTNNGLNYQDSILDLCTHSLITAPRRDGFTVHQASVLIRLERDSNRSFHYSVEIWNAW
jgi:hypothetical protein